MLNASVRTHSMNVFRILSSVIVLIILLGSLFIPGSGLAEAGSDPVISLSSVNAPACSGDDGASCITASFKADLTHSAEYEFDCSGDTIKLPLLESILSALGIPLSLFEKWIIPDVPTPLCTLFAQGSTLEITEKAPIGTYTKLLEETYNGEKRGNTFAVNANHTYIIELNGHGRDFREILEANNLTFDSFVNVTYQEIDPNDDICANAIPFDLPYSGNLEFSGDHDWQEIQSPVKGTMVLTLDVPEGKDYQLEVWSGDCQAVWVGSLNGTGVDEIVEIPVNWGAYHVHVYGKTAADFGEWYGVSAAFSGDLGDNQCENAALFDLPYNGNLEYSGDHDWQRIQSPLIGKMILNLDVPPDKDYQLEVWSDDCSSSVWILSNNGTGVDERFVMPVGSDYYRVHVYGKTAADFGEWYGICASFYSDLNDDVWEDAIPFDLPFDGNLEYSGDQDWQKINIPAGGATLVLDVPDGRNYDLELWRSDEKILLAASTNRIGLDEFIRVAQPGTYRIHTYGANPETDFDAWYHVFIVVDNTAPASSASLAGNVGSNGWFNSSVQVTLSAFDNPGGSGVQKIEYGFNNTPGIPYPGPWNVYTDPFIISSEGYTFLEFRSTDNAGNVEPNQVRVVKVDRTLPTVNILSPQQTSYPHSASLQIAWNAIDDISGIATSTAYLDGRTVANGQTINLLSLSLGPHTVMVIARDNAGYTVSTVVTFNVTADIDSVIGVTQSVYNLGWINKEGVFTSLKSSLAAAQQSIEHGQKNAAYNQLAAFLNKLEAQKGKAINQQAYDLLKAEVLAVMNTLRWQTDTDR